MTYTDQLAALATHCASHLRIRTVAMTDRDRAVRLTVDRMKSIMVDADIDRDNDSPAYITARLLTRNTPGLRLQLDLPDAARAAVDELN